jgi:hypothetical protein
MTELQQARADYIAALERENALSQEVQRLKSQNHELQMKLATAQCQATIAQGLATAYGRALLTV